MAFLLYILHPFSLAGCVMWQRGIVIVIFRHNPQKKA
uniref:Uncharacterized protein n=1 Tax=Rhizophora mucronata TaxID=61149 RepID=A0A2P2MGS0_RHIMU